MSLSEVERLTSKAQYFGSYNVPSLAFQAAGLCSSLVAGPGACSGDELEDVVVETMVLSLVLDRGNPTAGGIATV